MKRPENPKPNHLASGFFMPFPSLDTLAGDRRTSPSCVLPGEESQAEVPFQMGGGISAFLSGDLA
jgi:hypothetical protein